MKSFPQCIVLYSPLPCKWCNSFTSPSSTHLDNHHHHHTTSVFHHQERKVNIPLGALGAKEKAVRSSAAAANHRQKKQQPPTVLSQGASITL